MKKLLATVTLTLTFLTSAPFAFGAGENRSNPSSSVDNSTPTVVRAVSSERQENSVKRDIFPRHHAGNIGSRAGRD